MHLNEYTNHKKEDQISTEISTNKDLLLYLLFDGQCNFILHTKYYIQNTIRFNLS